MDTGIFKGFFGLCVDMNALHAFVFTVITAQVFIVIKKMNRNDIRDNFYV